MQTIKMTTIDHRCSNGIRQKKNASKSIIDNIDVVTQICAENKKHNNNKKHKVREQSKSASKTKITGDSNNNSSPRKGCLSLLNPQSLKSSQSNENLVDTKPQSSTSTSTSNSKSTTTTSPQIPKSQRRHEVKMLDTLNRLSQKLLKESYTTNTKKQRKGAKLIRILHYAHLKKISAHIENERYEDVSRRLRSMKSRVGSQGRCDGDPILRELTDCCAYWEGLNIGNNDGNCCFDADPADLDEDDVTETTGTACTVSSLSTRSSLLSTSFSEESLNSPPSSERKFLEQEEKVFDQNPEPEHKLRQEKKKVQVDDDNDDDDSDDDVDQYLSEGTEKSNESREQEEVDYDDNEDLSEDDDDDYCDILEPPLYDPFKIHSKSSSFDSYDYDIEFDSCIAGGILESVAENSDDESSDSDTEENDNGDIDEGNTSALPKKKVQVKDMKTSPGDALVRARALLENAKTLQKNMA